MVWDTVDTMVDTVDTMDTLTDTDTMDTVVDTTDTTTKAPRSSRYKNSTPSFHQDHPKLKQFFETSNTIRTKYKIVELISVF